MKPVNDAKSLSRTRYAQYAQNYVTSESHAKGADLDRLVELAQPQRHWAVLDAATGGGHTALKFAPLVIQVVATDLTPEMLNAARDFVATQRADNISFGAGDAENLPFRNNSFDAVTCRIAPHHFPNPSRFVRESARVLKPGGLLVAQDHVLPEDQATARYVDGFEKLRDPSHNKAFSVSEWLSIFQNAGFSVTNTEQLVKRHDFVPWAERQGCPPKRVANLISMMREAPVAVREWMQPLDFDTQSATFVNHHIIIAGRKN